MRRIVVRFAAGVAAALAAAAVRAACPIDFAHFLRTFQDDEAFRLAHMRFPVALSTLDRSAVPEPVPQWRRIVRGDLASLRLVSPPSTAVEAAQRLHRQTSPTSRGGRVVRFHSRDSDAFVVEYRFARATSCWQLTRVEDHSL